MIPPVSALYDAFAGIGAQQNAPNGLDLIIFVGSKWENPKPRGGCH
jgi:hypothetical protein